jgi:hypothetical protein
MHFAGEAEKGNWQRGHTARDVMEALNELAPQIGKLDGRGIVLERIGTRRIGELSAKSAQSAGHALKHLQADGQIEILPAEDRGKARSYRLLVPRAALYSMEGCSTEDPELRDEYQGVKGARPPHRAAS